MTQPSQEQFGVYAGRNIALKKLTDLQLMLMARETEKLRRNDSEDADSGWRVTSAARIMDLLDSVVLNDDDREFLLKETVAGRFDLPDALELIKTVQTDAAQSKPTVRRGRPRKRL